MNRGGIFLLLFGVILQTLGAQIELSEVREILSVPRQKTDWLVGVQDVIALDDGAFVVSDRLDYRLKKFDGGGNLTKEAGKRGSEKGEFRGPGPLAVWNEVVAVADYATSRIQIFTSNLEFRTGFQAPGHIFDLCFDREGLLWAGVLTGRYDENLVRMDLKGKVLQTIALRNGTKDPFDNMFWLAIDKSGDIIIAFLVRNKIEIWNTNGDYKREFEVSGLPARAKRKKISRSLFGRDLEVPEDNLFWDVAVDSKARILLLADEYTPNPDQDVYIVDKEGHLLSLLKLPHRSVSLSVDSRDQVFTTDDGRTCVRLLRLRREKRK